MQRAGLKLVYIVGFPQSPQNIRSKRLRRNGVNIKHSFYALNSLKHPYNLVAQSSCITDILLGDWGFPTLVKSVKLLHSASILIIAPWRAQTRPRLNIEL